MPASLDNFQECFHGQVCLIGVGNPDCGDDAFGVLLAEELLRSAKRNPPIPPAVVAHHGQSTSNTGFRHTVIPAGKTPERFVGRVVDSGFDHVIFLDAVEFGGAPGAVVFLDSKQMTARFPQVSTHKISLGLLARCVEAKGTTRAWLLGVQPESLKPCTDLTPRVRNTLNILAEILRHTGQDAPPRTQRRPGGIVPAAPPVAAPAQPAIANRPSPDP